MSGSGILIPTGISADQKRAWDRLQTVLNAHQLSIAGSQTTSRSFATQAQISVLQQEINALQAQVAALQSEIGGLSGGVVTYKSTFASPPFRVVYESGKGLVSLCDNTNSATAQSVAGITLDTASVGANVKVAGTGVTVTSSSWNWTAMLPIFVGASGLPTQTVPTAADSYCAPIGFAVTTTTVFVAICEPEFFADDNEGAPIVRNAAGQLQQSPVPILPSMNAIASGLTILVPADYNLLYDQSVGLDVEGVLDVEGDVLEMLA